MEMNMDIHTKISTYHIAVTDAVSEIPEKKRSRSPEMFSTSVMRRDLKKKLYEAEGVKK